MFGFFIFIKNGSNFRVAPTLSLLPSPPSKLGNLCKNSAHSHRLTGSPSTATPGRKPTLLLSCTLQSKSRRHRPRTRALALGTRPVRARHHASVNSFDKLLPHALGHESLQILSGGQLVQDFAVGLVKDPEGDISNGGGKKMPEVTDRPSYSSPEATLPACAQGLSRRQTKKKKKNR